MWGKRWRIWGGFWRKEFDGDERCGRISVCVIKFVFRGRRVGRL